MKYPFFSIALLWIWLVGVCHARPLIVGYHDWPPNQVMTDNNQAAGIDVELTKAIFAQAEIDIEFKFYPWKRILYLMERGEVDVAMSAGFTDERSQFLWYSGEVYRVGQNTLFIRSDSQRQFLDVKSLKDLESLDIKLGVTLGLSYSDEYDQLLENRSFVRLLKVYDNDQTKFELLALHRLDAVLAGKDIGQSWIDRLGLQNDVLPHMDLYPPEDGKTWLIYSKRSVSPETVKQVDEAIKTLRNAGALKRIITGVN